MTSNYTTNGGTNKLYTVRFPADVTQCAYQVTTGDTDPINNTQAVDGFVPAVTRSAIDVNTVAITLWQRNTPNGSFVTAQHGAEHLLRHRVLLTVLPVRRARSLPGVAGPVGVLS